MSTISITLRDDLSEEEQDEVIGEVGSLPGVQRATPLRPHARSKRLRRFCFAEVASEDAQEIGALLERMLEIRGVESASVPAPRRALEAIG